MAIASGRRVSNALLREHALRTDQNLYVVCIRLDWFNSKGQPDTHRLKRALGITRDYAKGCHTVNGYRTHLSEERAADIARAMGLLPLEIGL